MDLSACYALGASILEEVRILIIVVYGVVYQYSFRWVHSKNQLKWTEKL